MEEETPRTSQPSALGENLSGDGGYDPLNGIGIKVPQGDQMVGERLRLVAGPGVERGDELRLLDQAGLEGEQAEEEMAVGGHGLPEINGENDIRGIGSRSN